MRDQLIGTGMPYPTHLVDVTTVQGLAGIRIDDGGASSARRHRWSRSPSRRSSGATCRCWPRPRGEVASPEIRAIGTLGGNIHQRPRCWFLRNKDFDCIKKGGDICFAVKGDNRYNAILGGQLCYIVQPSDLAMGLVALGAEGVVASPEGTRTISFDDYFVGPEQDLLHETVLKPDDLLTEVRIPLARTDTHQAWRKLNEKGAPTWDFAVVSAAVAMSASDGIWQSGRIVLGGVAPFPYRATIVEEALAGQDIRSALTEAAATIHTVARPMRYNAYKVGLAERVIHDAVLTALGRAPVAAGLGPGEH